MKPAFQKRITASKVVAALAFLPTCLFLGLASDGAAFDSKALGTVFSILGYACLSVMIVAILAWYWLYMSGKGYNPFVELIAPFALFAAGAIWVVINEAAEIPKLFILGAAVIATQRLLQPDLYPEEHDNPEPDT